MALLALSLPYYTRILLMKFTYSDIDLNRCTISSTVTGHHTDVVLLVVLEWKLNGGVGSDKDGATLNWWRDTDDVMVSHINWIPSNLH